MNATPVDRAPVTAALKAYLLDETGRPGDVGRAPKPADGQTAPRMPYWILYPLEGGRFAGPAQSIEADAALPYQVTCVGEQGHQLELLADRVRRAFAKRDEDGHHLVPAGDTATLMSVDLEDSLSGMDFEGPIGSIPVRATLWVTTS